MQKLSTPTVWNVAGAEQMSIHHIPENSTAHVPL
jgi:hypothetical protein